MFDFRRFSFKMFAAPKTVKQKTQTSYDKKEDWEYRTFDKNPGGKWERVEKAKNPNTYRIKKKDISKDKPSKKDEGIEEEKSKEESKKFKKREQYREVSEKAQDEFDQYYGKTDDREKEKIEKDAAKQLSDFIQKSSKGESVEFPDLPSDMKVKFFTAMFLLYRTKQMDEIKAPTPYLEKQKQMVIAKIESKAIDALKEVTDHLSTKGRIERHIQPPKDPESIFKKRSIKKPVAEMTDDEYSDIMGQRDEKEPLKMALRKKEMRDKDINDIPASSRQNAVDVSNTIKDYRKNFGKFNKDIAGAVKIKKTGSRTGFVMEGYTPSESAVTSNVSLPVEDMPYHKLAPALNETIKKLTSNGFKGKIEIETDPDSLLLNKGNIKIIADDIKHSQAASEMLKEAFANNGIETKIDLEKNQFGMAEPEQIKYMTNLKRLALHSTTNGKFNLPSDKIGKYMIAARLRGYDLVPAGKLYGLRPHASDSPVGQIKLDNKTDPEELKKTLFDAYSKEKEGFKEEEAPEIKLDNPFEGLKKTMDEYQRENGEFETEEEPSPQDEYSEERMDKLFPRRDTEIQGDDYSNSLSSEELDTKIKSGDTSSLNDFLDKSVSSMEDPLIMRAYGKSFINKVNDFRSSLKEKGINLTPEMEDKIKRITDKIQSDKSEAKTEDAFDFSNVQGYEKNEYPTEFSPEWLKEMQLKNTDESPTGWVLVKTKDKDFNDRYKIVSADGKHSIWGDTKDPQSLKDYANKNQYKVQGAKTWLDPIDYDESEISDSGNADIKEGKTLITNKPVDHSNIETLTSHYGISKDSPAIKELLGFKRLIYKNLSPEDREDIKKEGLLSYLERKPSMKTMVSDFAQRMNPKNYTGNDYEEMKKKISGITPVDFVKMLNGIKAKGS